MSSDRAGSPRASDKGARRQRVSPAVGVARCGCSGRTIIHGGRQGRTILNCGRAGRTIFHCVLIALALVAAIAQSGCVTYGCDGVASFGNLGPAVNSPYDDYAPALPDTATLVLTSNRIIPGRGGLHEHGRADRPTYLYSSMRLTASWDEARPHPVVLGIDDTEGGTISFAPAGSPFATVAYISACFVPGTIGGCDLYAVTAGDRPAIVNLGREINSPAWDGQPFVTADGTRLYFASEREGGLGRSDIWYSERQPSGAWGPPRNAGPAVNTADDEVSPFVDPATHRLLFASVVEGRGRDLFVVEEEGERRFALPAPYNSEYDEFTPYLAGGRLYLASNRPGGCGGYDLYGFTAP
jgi:hypothetical protein